MMLKKDEEKNTHDGVIQPAEIKRTRTTVILPQPTLDAASKIGVDQKLSQTAIVAEALSDWVVKKTDTAAIDSMLKETSGFWFERDLSRVLALLPLEQAKNLTAPQKTFLYQNLKDTADRDRVFSALNLCDDLDDINSMNELLEKVSIFQGDQLIGYNAGSLANNVRAKILTAIQAEYLSVKIGSEAFEKFKARRPDLFPEINVFKDEDATTFASEEVPLSRKERQKSGEKYE
jgi:hypothetical protein